MDGRYCCRPQNGQEIYFHNPMEQALMHNPVEKALVSYGSNDFVKPVYSTGMSGRSSVHILPREEHNLYFPQTLPLGSYYEPMVPMNFGAMRTLPSNASIWTGPSSVVSHQSKPVSNFGLQREELHNQSLVIGGQFSGIRGAPQMSNISKEEIRCGDEEVLIFRKNEKCYQLVPKDEAVKIVNKLCIELYEHKTTIQSKTKSKGTPVPRKRGAQCKGKNAVSMATGNSSKQRGRKRAIKKTKEDEEEKPDTEEMGRQTKFFWGSSTLPVKLCNTTCSSRASHRCLRSCFNSIPNNEVEVGGRDTPAVTYSYKYDDYQKSSEEECQSFTVAQKDRAEAIKSPAFICSNKCDDCHKSSEEECQSITVAHTDTAETIQSPLCQYRGPSFMKYLPLDQHQQSSYMTSSLNRRYEMGGSTPSPSFPQ